MTKKAKSLVVNTALGFAFFGGLILLSGIMETYL